ncbi:hypothetical protein PINS_up014549 [Pythium insidiosum]|nr:hypothetical protein PINS_up014549 [Pythium insidiosum]
MSYDYDVFNDTDDDDHQVSQAGNQTDIGAETLANTVRDLRLVDEPVIAPGSASSDVVTSTTVEDATEEMKQEVDRLSVMFLNHPPSKIWELVYDDFYGKHQQVCKGLTKEQGATFQYFTS